MIFRVCDVVNTVVLMKWNYFNLLFLNVQCQETLRGFDGSMSLRCVFREYVEERE